MLISANLAIILFPAFFLAIFLPAILALLCAFGCRELPAPQIVSSAQFRSFIMPRDVRLHGCIGCCGACGDGDAAEPTTMPEGGGDDGIGGTEGGNGDAEEEIMEKPSTRIMVGMNPPETTAKIEGGHGHHRVWYSSPGSGLEGGHWRG